MTRLILSLLALAVTAPAAAAQDYAPVDRRGPALTIPRDKLAASLSCSDDVRNAKRMPVLLTPATTVTSRENFGWNWIPALRALGYPVCTSDQPAPDQQNMGDMQTRAEYVVYAIRRVHRLSGRRIAIIGHSQGGMIMRWPLRFWPGTRRMVRDVVGMAATNHGSVVVQGICASECAPALWQQRDDSAWTAALNSGQESFAGIHYTEIYSRNDEFVQPNLDDTGTSSLRPGPGRIANVALQDICPEDTDEHLLIGTTNAVAWALGTDALAHAGPADETRIDPAVCGQSTMPGVDPTTGPLALAEATARVNEQLTFAPKTAAEPELRCYVTASCPAVAPRRCRVVLRVRRSLRRVRVTLGGRRVRIVRRAGGRVVIRLPAGRARLVVRGRAPGGRSVRRVRVVRAC